MKNFDLQFPANAFVDALGRAVPSGCVNPWAGTSGTERRRNLTSHLRATCPKFLFVTDSAQESDAGASGVPLAPLGLVGAGLVPRVTPLGAPRTLPPEPGVEEFWRSLHRANEAGSSLCFAAVPFLANLAPGYSLAWRNLAIEHIKWVAAISNWHRSIRVFAMAEHVSSLLRDYGIQNTLLNSGIGVAAPLHEERRLYRVA